MKRDWLNSLQRRGSRSDPHAGDEQRLQDERFRQVLVGLCTGVTVDRPVSLFAMLELELVRRLHRSAFEV
jgi:hypothetical protein